MKIAIPKERRPGEKRVAGSPDVVRRLIGLGAEVAVEAGAGVAAGMTDEAFSEAGATIVADEAELLADADVVLKVRRPLTEAEGGPDEVAMMKEGAVLIGFLEPLSHPEQSEDYAARKLVAMAMELVPRITRAQAMDALSSQSTIAGYKAVIEAAAAFHRIFPMMMTAAGTIAPARVLVLGAGVAGLQAIATARRLGAVVSASDVRPAVKQEVESLGATFIEVEAEEEAQTAGGYAKEMSEDYKRRQAEAVAAALAKSDVAITTALIPGRPAPLLINEEMVGSMKPGSVIVDMAVEAGGNCAFSKPGKVVQKKGVTIIGYANLAAMVASDSSALYARNLFNVLGLIIDKETKALAIDWDDEIIGAMALTRDGAVVERKAPA